MSINESRPQPSIGETIRLMELMEIDIITQSIKDFAEHVLSSIARMVHSNSAILYLVDSQFSEAHFFQYGFQPHEVSEIEKLCTDNFNSISNQPESEPVSINAPQTSKMADKLILYPLRTEKVCVGLIGLTVHEDLILSDLFEKLFSLVANTFSLFTERVKSERQLSNLNKYLTISSMIAQSLDLHELLGITLQCCMEAVSAEAASILILDDEK
ncbi:hypothetical protein ACFL1R_10075, partial [Candidatus Latescibacterota bacterium]